MKKIIISAIIIAFIAVPFVSDAYVKRMNIKELNEYVLLLENRIELLEFTVSHTVKYSPDTVPLVKFAPRLR